jgi:hypothetical protein
MSECVHGPCCRRTERLYGLFRKVIRSLSHSDIQISFLLTLSKTSVPIFSLPPLVDPLLELLESPHTLPSLCILFLLRSVVFLVQLLDLLNLWQELVNDCRAANGNQSLFWSGQSVSSEEAKARIQRTEDCVGIVVVSSEVFYVFVGLAEVVLGCVDRGVNLVQGWRCHDCLWLFRVESIRLKGIRVLLRVRKTVWKWLHYRRILVAKLDRKGGQ